MSDSASKCPIPQPEFSSVEAELEALDHQLGRVSQELTNIGNWNKDGQEHAIQCARKNLETALQRSYRAVQISKGLAVYKST